MREVTLTRGLVALVDDGDFDVLNALPWCALSASGYFYAAMGHLRDDGKRSTLLMHRLITMAPPGIRVDHIDRDTLNNQRSNLRLCTISQNAMNRGANKGRRFKGAYFDARRGNWNAKLTVGRRRVFLGVYETEEEAARAYDAGAIKHHGEFAGLNFPHTTGATIG